MALFDLGRDKGWYSINYPCKVHFQGFTSDTLKLQNNGWELSAEQNRAEDYISLSMRNKNLDTVLFASQVRGVMGKVMISRYNRGNEDYKEIEFNITHILHSKSRIALIPETFTIMEPIDARIDRQVIKSLDEYQLFRPLMQESKEIIVEPESVMECLELIKKLQAPDLAKIRERNNRKETFRSIQAQIVTMAA